jgi:hypothetical protein
MMTNLEIQTALKAAGFYKGPLDSDIGPQSKQAIRAFQRSKKLRADGIVGPKTLAALKAVKPAPAPAPGPAPTDPPKPPAPAALTPEGKIRLYGPRLAKEFSLDVASNAAIWGNFGHESGLKPKALGPGKDFGLAQHVGIRKRRLVAFCKARGLGYDTLEGQLEFIIHELKTTHKSAIPAVKRPGTLMEKVVRFERIFEVAHPSYKHYGSRHAWARRALKALS